MTKCDNCDREAKYEVTVHDCKEGTIGNECEECFTRLNAEEWDNFQPDITYREL